MMDGWIDDKRGPERCQTMARKKETFIYFFSLSHTLLMASQEKAVTLSPECNLNKKTKMCTC